MDSQARSLSHEKSAAELVRSAASESSFIEGDDFQPIGFGKSLSSNLNQAI
jgi:hypothetical protein